jgi:hypothetical protein
LKIIRLLLSKPVVRLYGLFARRRQPGEAAACMRNALKDYPADRHVHNIYGVCEVLDELDSRPGQGDQHPSKIGATIDVPSQPMRREPHGGL